MASRPAKLYIRSKVGWSFDREKATPNCTLWTKALLKTLLKEQ
ncbi:hypothetical protein [Acidicapsa acidisoli]|nr:hypothetical protein [Acidicapsa acidisoli]